jgi:hypothetical protein
MTTGKDQTTPEREQKTDEPKPEDTPSSHETSGQFPADEVAATFKKAEPKT